MRNNLSRHSDTAQILDSPFWQKGERACPRTAPRTRSPLMPSAGKCHRNAGRCDSGAYCIRIILLLASVKAPSSSKKDAASPLKTKSGTHTYCSIYTQRITRNHEAPSQHVTYNRCSRNDAS